jgi:nitroreductase
MELADALRTNPSIRDFTQEPVDDATVAALLELARFAPSGGNRQPWHVAVIKDPGLRRQLADLCGPVWSEYLAERMAGVAPFNVIDRPSEIPDLGPQPNPVLDGIEDVPVVLVVAADLSVIAMMDAWLDRPALSGGASIYPFVLSILLAARDRGLGGVLTTFLARAEDEARPLLGLPSSWAIAAMVCLGHPVRRPTKLTRRSVDEFATVDRFDGPPLPPG